MNIAVIGTGYVGLVTGTCFASKGHNVFCVDVNEEKIKKLNEGIIPIYEPGLEDLIKAHKTNIHFTTSLRDALRVCDVCFIAVGTPMGEDGSADLQYVLSVAKSIGNCMRQHMYVIDKSTVPVGTADKVRNAIQEELNERKSNLTFDVISNPEFLKEGSAVNDVLFPDRIVVGTDSERALNKMDELYEHKNNIIFMDIRSAEMTKYTANAMLATKISFINEISNICEKVGANINKVRLGIATDRRIGPKFINPGCGYGGSCFPKDVKALVKTSEDYGYTPKILNSVEVVNAEQKMVLVKKILNTFNDVNEKTIAVWGLSFKPETDDMREAPAITLINELSKNGANIKCYDPKAMEEAKRCYLKDVKNVTYCEDKFEAAKDADALVILTEWEEFLPLNTDYKALKYILKNPIIFDGRNIFEGDPREDRLAFIEGYKYYQIGVK